VIGVMEPKGEMLGFDLDDIAYVPVATAMQIFNLTDLGEVDLTYSPAEAGPRIEAEVKRVLKARHDDEEDFTVTTPAGDARRLRQRDGHGDDGRRGDRRHLARRRRDRHPDDDVDHRAASGPRRSGSRARSGERGAGGELFLAEASMVALSAARPASRSGSASAPCCAGSCRACPSRRRCRSSWWPSA
jgi:hypothetical protein